MNTYNFASIIQESAARYPSKTALITPQITLNYSELTQRVNQAGNFFLSLGVNPGDRVSILFNNDYRFLEICFGLMSIGAIPVPMNAKLGAETLAYVYRNSGSRVLIFHDELSEKVQAVQQISEASILVRCASVNEQKTPVALSYDELLPLQSLSLELYPSEEGDICFLPYTSGSTGNPKGCRLTHRGQLWNVQSTSQLRGLTDETRVIISLPLYHKNAMTTMKTIFWLGASAVILPKADPEQILKAIETHRVTYMTGVPALYRMLINYLKEHPGFDLTSLLLVSAVLPIHLANYWMRFNCSWGCRYMKGMDLPKGDPLCWNPGRVFSERARQVFQYQAVRSESWMNTRTRSGRM